MSLEAHERIVATWEHSVVIDNTNPSASVRAEYIAIAQDQEIPVRCFVFKTPLELAQHMNSYRQNVFGVKHVPGVGYNMYVSYLFALTSAAHLGVISC